jgi:site-specific DNA-methyltransferase (adenine-specific)
LAKLEIHFGDNLEVLAALPDKSVRLVYIDPPYNTGKVMRRHEIEIQRQGDGPGHLGFEDQRYKSVRVGTMSFSDIFQDDEYLLFLEERLVQIRRILTDDGSLFFHIGGPQSHYCKILLDAVFGRDSFMNEIVWAWDYGARTKKRWPSKHDVIFWYVKNPKKYVFELDECDRIPYLSPLLVGTEKAARGKTPTDTWWHTIVSPQSFEKTGYPSQKPLGILERIVKVHSKPGDLLCDVFAGSGSFGEAATKNDRDCLLADNNRQAMIVMEKRFRKQAVTWKGWVPKTPVD